MAFAPISTPAPTESGLNSAIPASLNRKYILGLVEVFLTNGSGVAVSADPIYQELIEKFTPEQASLALRSFTDPDVVAKLHRPLSQQKWAQLLQIVEHKLTGRSERELFDAVQAFAGDPFQLGLGGFGHTGR